MRKLDNCSIHVFGFGVATEVHVSGISLTFPTSHNPQLMCGTDVITGVENGMDETHVNVQS